MKKILFAVFCLSILSACEKPAEAPKARKQPSERDHATVVREVNGHELLVLDVPSSGLLGLVENTNCFVWRDKEFKTASISCPRPEVHISKD